MKQIVLTLIFCCVIFGTVQADTIQYGNWTQAGPVPPFGPRADYGSTVFHDQIFLIGGQNTGPQTPDPKSYAMYNDIWSTTDGTNWTQLTSNATFSPRRSLKVAVFNNKIWVIGGFDANSRRNDVWSSSDGSNWSLVTANASFGLRSNPVVVVFDNKLWVIGGNDYQYQLNDVWSSSDGSNWTQITNNAGFSRWVDFYLSGAVFDKRIFIFDAAVSQESWGTNEIWSTSDGKNWTLVNKNASFRVMEYIPVTVFNDRLWIVGGGNDPWVSQNKAMAAHPENFFYFNSVWSSVDGNNWTLETEHAGFSPRYGMGVVTFRNRIWVLGGHGLYNANDVWYLPLLMLTPSTVPSTSNYPVVSGTSVRAAMGPIFPFLSLIIVAGICVYRSKAGKR